MQKNRTIILMGIKHSGKSTQGRLLAGHFGCPFIDIDDEILKILENPRGKYTQKKDRQVLCMPKKKPAEK